MYLGILYSIYVINAAALGVAAVRLAQAERRFAPGEFDDQAPTGDELPSVTVCVPARNEGHAMTETLQRLVASTYPKLEIIVMDDLSADKTPALIKAFAHDGVRFIEGEALPGNWLGKNHALNTLLAQASGSYVMFMDVDTHVGPQTIERLMRYALREKAAMVSVVPRREDGVRASTVGAPLRYFWELMFHRPVAPAVASAAWLLDRRRFKADFSDFSKLAMVIQPEAHIAATYMASNEYRFVMSTTALGLTHEKKWRSQMDTSIRLLYPLLGARPINAVIAMVDLLVMAAPLLLLVLGITMGWSVHYIGAAILYVAGVLVYGRYLRRRWRVGSWFGAILWPYIILQEMVLVGLSAVKYARKTVTWKGRTVRLPRRR